MDSLVRPETHKRMAKRRKKNAGKRPGAHRRIYGIVETSTQRTYDVGKKTAHRSTKRRRKTLNFKTPIAP